MKDLIDNITWLSLKSMILLQSQAKQLPLTGGKIHAKQGGAYLSSFKGRGMEFDEARLYLPGDDIRNMDWRVTARTGDAHTKVFREERERPVLIWLDLNASMMFATRGAYKAVIASEAAALLAWSATAHNDRLGALLFSGDQHTEIRPRQGKRAVLDLIGRIDQHPAWEQPPQERDMCASVSRLRKVARPGSLVFMLSDFRGLDEQARRHLGHIAKHCDVVMIDIHDPIEARLPEQGEFQVSDGEKIVHFEGGDHELRHRYHQRFRRRQVELTSFCRQRRIYHLPLKTTDDVLSTLQQGLGMRSNLHSQYRSA